MQLAQSLLAELAVIASRRTDEPSLPWWILRTTTHDYILSIPTSSPLSLSDALHNFHAVILCTCLPAEAQRVLDHANRDAIVNRIIRYSNILTPPTCLSPATWIEHPGTNPKEATQ